MPTSRESSSYSVERPKLINGDVLLGSLPAAKELGIDLKPSLEKSGINPDMLLAPKGFLPIHSVVSFLNDVAERFDCPDFGFHVSRHHPPLQFGITGQLVKFAATLREALDDSARFGRLYSQVSQWRLEESGKIASLKRYSLINFPEPLVQYHVMAVTHVFKGVVKLCEGRFAASEVAFTHAEPANPAIYRRFFGAPVRFNHNFNGIVFPREYLDLQRDSADLELYRVLKMYLESQDNREPRESNTISRVQQHIRRNLGSGSCNLESIAQLMGLGPRSLQRELAASGVTFREVLLGVRQDIAQHYIRNSTITLAELADLLGYRNASALSRAFKNNTGLSPENWKQRNRVDESLLHE